MKPEYWNVKAGKIIGRNVKVQEVNNILESIKTTMTKIYRDLQEKESNTSLERIKNIFFGVEIKNQMLLDLFRRYNEDIHKMIGISRSMVCYNKYDITYRRLANFLKEEYHVSDISLQRDQPQTNHGL
ncbi:MAG: hypothetical protein LBF05_07985 [Tannerella sp.]|nr:hypothetical protein [Tannerella sp.]